MGRLTMQTLDLLVTTTLIGVVGGGIYYVLRGLLVGPRWFRILSVSVGPAVVVGSRLVHVEGVICRLVRSNATAHTDGRRDRARGTSGLARTRSAPGRDRSAVRDHRRRADVTNPSYEGTRTPNHLFTSPTLDINRTAYGMTAWPNRCHDCHVRHVPFTFIDITIDSLVATGNRWCTVSATISRWMWLVSGSRRPEGIAPTSAPKTTTTKTRVLSSRFLDPTAIRGQQVTAHLWVSPASAVTATLQRWTGTVNRPGSDGGSQASEG
jgi:hypothetical protein